MKTTINLSDELIATAMKETGIKEKTKLIHMGLELLFQKQAKEKLAGLFGSERGLKQVDRRRRIQKP